MAKQPFTENPYPDVQVTEDQRKQLINLVDGFVQDHFQEYEEFVIVDKHQVDKRRWKHVKSKDNQHVYTERIRQTVTTTSNFESWNPTTAKENAAPQKNLPVVLSVGTLPGDLNDFMFGAINPTLDIMRIKASYVHDYDNAAILCSEVEPNEEEPFRSIIIKWMTVDLPLQATNLVKKRDFVYIEASGMIKLPNGERVGFYMLHSIEFPQTKPQPNFIRGNYSVFGFFRQTDGNVIDVFARGTIDPGGEIKRFLLTLSVAEALFSVENCVYCGQMKKLSWVLQRQHSTGKRQTQLYSGKCVVCSKKTTRGAIGAVGRSTCKLCYGSVCFKCKTRKRISFITQDGQLIQRKITFCEKCVSKANECDAKEAATDQAKGVDPYKTFSGLSDSDSIEASSSDEM